jgi:hypothetical protein
VAVVLPHVRFLCSSHSSTLLLTVTSNLPIGVVVFLVVLVLLKIPNDPHSQPFQRSLPLLSKISRLDFLGLTFLVGGCVCLFLALQRGLVDGDWKSEHTVGLFIGSGIIGIALVAHEWALGDNAMIPASVLGQRSILMASTFLGFSQATSLVVSIAGLRLNIY